MPVMTTSTSEPGLFRSLTRPERLSYLLMLAMILLIGWLHMATLLLTALFCYLALRNLSFRGSKLVGLTLFFVLLSVTVCGLFYFSKQAYVAFPKMAETTIPAVTGFAERQGIELAFTDYASLKTLMLAEVQERFANLGRYARDAVFILAYLVIGIVVAVSLFFNARFRVEGDPHTSGDNLYTLTWQELTTRFRTFYRSFATVMGAQILISAVNSVLTAAFLFGTGFPHALVLTVFTFLCGLLPIIGNIISNTVITGVGFTLSPQMALFALMFLIAIHKLEYFLNSKIIGGRIKNPMWLTLLGLVLGEKLMGIPGMILAPAVLHYIKVEASRAKVHAQADAEEPPAEALK
jgi:predicted PurR-regulated permease PerM